MMFLQVLISSLASLAVLFILTKLMGSKQVSQLSMFDYIIGITIGSIAAEAATELEQPLKSFEAMVIYGISACLVSVLSEKVLSVRKLMTGKPLVLMDNGKIFFRNLKKCRIDVSDFLMQCRSAGYFDLNQIQTAVMEYNGAISFLPVSTERPLTPTDMNFSPQQDFMQSAVIMDGHVIAPNLKLTGNNEVWLTRKLHDLGYKSVKEILLALCDNSNNLTVFVKDKSAVPSEYSE